MSLALLKSVLGWRFVAGAVLGVVVIGGIQQFRVYRAQLALQKIETQIAEDKAAQEKAAREAQESDKEALEKHGVTSHENELVYVEGLRAAAESARADADLAERLRRAAESRATRYRDLSQTGTASIKYLVDRLNRLEAHTAEGAAVVGDLRGLVERRDAEVKALQGQMAADRALMDAAH